MAEHCPGSGEFPDNFDGEFTVCKQCRRKMNLDPQGLVPRHQTREPKNYLPNSVAYDRFPDIRRDAD